MNAQQTNTVIKKETKKKIRVEFERTSFWERFKIRFLSLFFLKKLAWWIFRLVLLIGVSYIILFPFFSKITSSFMSPDDFVDVTVKLIPKYPTLDTYKAIIVEGHYFQIMFNTACLSILCGVIQTLICSIVGYGFAKFKFKGNKILFACVLLTMVVPQDTLRTAMYVFFRYFDIFGIFKLLGIGAIEMQNTYWPLALLSLGGLAFKNGLYIFMMRQFYRGVPDELEESAYVDGSGVMKTFFKIIVPLSIPMMITVFLFAFSWQWTDRFYTDVFFTDQSSILLMPDLIFTPKSLDTSFAAGDLYVAAIRNTCGLLIILPLVVVYLFCQRFLIQGIERSGIVG